MALVSGQRIFQIVRQGRRHRARKARLQLPDRAAGSESKMSTTTNNANNFKPAPQPIASAAEAENLVRHLLAAMDALVATVEQETTLVRAGNVKQAAALEATKAELARAYAADNAQVKANLPALKAHVPDLLAKLQQ